MKIKMKHDYSLTTGRLLFKDCHYDINDNIAKDLVDRGQAYRLKQWKEGAIDCKQYVDYI